MVTSLFSETGNCRTYMVSHLYGLPHKSKSQFENDKWPPTSILLRIRNPLRFQVLENSGILIWRSKYPKKNRALRARMRLSSHYVTIVLTQKCRRRFKKYMYYVNVIVSETRKSFALIWSLTYMVILRLRNGIFTYMVHHISERLLYSFKVL